MMGKNADALYCMRSKELLTLLPHQDHYGNHTTCICHVLAALFMRQADRHRAEIKPETVIEEKLQVLNCSWGKCLLNTRLSAYSV